MLVSDFMTRDPITSEPTTSLRLVAQMMATHDCAAIPIVRSNAVVGIVTDRDIAVRSIAGGVSPSMPVRRIMSANVTTCSPEDSVEEALGTMANEQVRRLPVCDDRDRLVGIVGLGDAANRDPDEAEVGSTLAEICQQTGLHCQEPAAA